MLQYINKGLRIITVTLIAALMPQLVLSSPPPFYQEQRMIEEIARDVTTPQRKAKVVAELTAIVEDKANDIHLRQFAAEKLGELGAIEAKDMLKGLAESLEWTDATRYLKGAVTLAYWQIRVAEEPNEMAQEELLIKLVRGGPPPQTGGTVPWWAVDELANRGVKRALPDMIKRIKVQRDGDDKYSQEIIWLCETKIRLLSTSKTRQDALIEALLAVEDTTWDLRLKSWAIKELGKLRTQESQGILIAYALQLQEKYYDQNGKRIFPKDDRLGSNASVFYNDIIKILKHTRMTDSDIKATGLEPGKFFIITF
jgi:hypothetical protein